MTKCPYCKVAPESVHRCSALGDSLIDSSAWESSVSMPDREATPSTSGSYVSSEWYESNRRVMQATIGGLSDSKRYLRKELNRIRKERDEAQARAQPVGELLEVVQVSPQYRLNGKDTLVIQLRTYRYEGMPQQKFNPGDKVYITKK